MGGLVVVKIKRAAILSGGLPEGLSEILSDCHRVRPLSDGRGGDFKSRGEERNPRGFRHRTTCASSGKYLSIYIILFVILMTRSDRKRAGSRSLVEDGAVTHPAALRRPGTPLMHL